MQDELELISQNAAENQHELAQRKAEIEGLKMDAEQATTRMRAAQKMWEELSAGLKPGEVGAPLTRPNPAAAMPSSATAVSSRRLCTACCSEHPHQSAAASTCT